MRVTYDSKGNNVSSREEPLLRKTLSKQITSMDQIFPRAPVANID